MAHMGRLRTLSPVILTNGGGLSTCHRCGQACQGHSWGWGVGWPGCSSCSRQWTEASETIWRLLGQEPQEERYTGPFVPFQPCPIFFLFQPWAPSYQPPPRLPPAPPLQQPGLWPHQELRHPSKLLGLCPHHALCLGPISVCGRR